jgi:hypothetical protein
MSKYETTDVHEWLNFGFDKGWISDVFCNTHDAGPVTNEEEAEWEEGGDPCMQCVRVIGIE